MLYRMFYLYILGCEKTFRAFELCINSILKYRAIYDKLLVNATKIDFQHVIQLFIHYIANQVSVDIIFFPDQCCHTIRVSTTGPANSSQSVRMGLYERVDTFFDRPVYLHQEIDEYLFYMGGRTRGLWMIGPEVGFFRQY